MNLDAEINPEYTAIESFSGAGGLSLGLKRAGWRVLAAFDIDKWAVKTYNHNLGPHGFVEDIRKLNARELLRKVNGKKDLDLFSGGPPCQGFSKQKRGAHLLIDSRNELVVEFAKVVNELKPRSFVLENVSMLGQKRGEMFLEAGRELIGDYEQTAHFYNSADYGLAQTRERFIIVGIRSDIDAVFRIPKPTVTKWKTVREAIGDLPEPPEDYSNHPDYPNHQRARVTKINIERFSHVPPGGGWQDIPYDLRLECHKTVNIKSGGWPDVYGRLTWDGQCPTITGGFDSFTRGRYGHPAQNRPLTPREAARLQGFPDDFVFLGTRGDIRKQIGNAVPPPLAEAIGKAIQRVLLIEDGFLKPEKRDFVSQPTIFDWQINEGFHRARLAE